MRSERACGRAFEVGMDWERAFSFFHVGRGAGRIPAMNIPKPFVSSDAPRVEASSVPAFSNSAYSVSDATTDTRLEISQPKRLKSWNGNVVPVSRRLSSQMGNMGLCCAVLVVFIHVGTPTPTGTFPWFFLEFFHAILSDVAVPYFFLASGFFLAGHMGEQGWYPREIKKRFWTLLVPYVLWATLYAVYLLPVGILANLNAHRSWCWNLGVPDWVWVFGLDFLHSPLLYPLWFVRWLMCLCLASPLLYWVARKTGRWGVMAVYLFAVFENVRIVYMNCASWSGWWSWKWLDHLFGLFYFLLGISWRLGIFENVPNWVKCLPVGLGLTFLATKVASFVAVGFGFAMPDCGIGMFYSQHVFFAIPCLLALIWHYMSPKKWPPWLTGTSFGLYLAHPFFINVINSILWFEGIGLGEGGLCLLRLVVGLGGGLASALILKKCFPRLAKLLLGGR